MFKSLVRSTPRFTTVLKHHYRDPFLSPFYADVPSITGMLTPFFRPFELPKDFDSVFRPSLDIKEQDGNYVAKLNLPGIDKSKVDISLAPEGRLTVNADTSTENFDEKNEGYHIRERHSGSIQRQWSIPKGVKDEDIKASLQEGVLTIKYPNKPDDSNLASKIEID